MCREKQILHAVQASYSQVHVSCASACAPSTTRKMPSLSETSWFNLMDKILLQSFIIIIALQAGEKIIEYCEILKLTALGTE